MWADSGIVRTNIVRTFTVHSVTQEFSVFLSAKFLSAIS